MAQPGPSSLFITVLGPSSVASTASPSVMAISDEARFLSSFLDRTHDLISFTQAQHASLSPTECDHLALGQATILPLLCSAIHAISMIGIRIKDLFTAVHTLQSQVANSLVDQELRDLHNAVCNLSHRVAPTIVYVPPSQSSLPQSGARQGSGWHNFPPASPVSNLLSSHPRSPLVLLPTHAPILMSCMVAPWSLIRPLLIIPPGAKAKARPRDSLLVPPL